MHFLVSHKGLFQKRKFSALGPLEGVQRIRLNDLPVMFKRL